MNHPLVSISCITYNHAPYIRECLDGFLMQKCDFDFEVLIHDDASTDGTQDIIREYQEKHPEIIKPILQKENKWSQGVRNMNVTFNISRSQGKYIALCEGDDFWTDPLKLQKQVDFLEENMEYSMCFHGAKTIYEVKGENKDFPSIESRDYEIDEVFRTWYVPTASIVLRKDVINYFRENLLDSRILNGDLIIILTCYVLGKVKGFKEVMSVYRVHEGGISTSQLLPAKILQYKLKYIPHYEYIKEKFPQISPIILKIKFGNMYNEIAHLYLKDRNYSKFIFYKLKQYQKRPKRLVKDILNYRF